MDESAVRSLLAMEQRPYAWHDKIDLRRGGMDYDANRHSVRSTRNHLDLLDIKIDNVDFKETDSGQF